ncbi:unnamed protein product, partial [Prunus brigantina]
MCFISHIGDKVDGNLLGSSLEPCAQNIHTCNHMGNSEWLCLISQRGASHSINRELHTHSRISQSIQPSSNTSILPQTLHSVQNHQNSSSKPPFHFPTNFLFLYHHHSP